MAEFPLIQLLEILEVPTGLVAAGAAALVLAEVAIMLAALAASAGRRSGSNRLQ